MGISQLQVGEYRTLSHGVASALSRAILDGTLAPGTRLVEASISEQLGVSIAPVREAIISLEKLGLVTSTPRKGAFVATWTLNDIEEVYTARMLLEGYASRLAAGRITPEQCDDLQNIIDRMSSEQDSLTLEESVELDLRFHERLCAASGHSRIQKMLGDMRLQTAVCIARSRPAHPPWNTPGELERQHEELLEALRSGNGDLAELRMREHVERSRDVVVGRMARQRQPASSPSDVSPGRATSVLATQKDHPQLRVEGDLG